MPLLDAHHDLAHPVEADGAWSESYYFNGYDPEVDCGLFTRIGVRANEGTIDVGMSVWLPGGGLAEYHHQQPAPAPADGHLEVGGVRYDQLEVGSRWRVAMQGAGRVRAEPTRSVDLDLDLTFDGLTPQVGTDGSPSGPRSAQAAAAAATVGKGHFEQAGRWSGHVAVDGHRVEWRGGRGNRDRSWGPRRWGGPRMWRWFSINVGDGLHLGGIRLGTDAGDLHRGWIYDHGKVTSVAEWRIRTELAPDGVTHRVVHLDVVDKSGGTISLRGDVLRVANIGTAGGTMVNEGLARWERTDSASSPVGYGICEYLHQLDDAGRPLVPVE